MIFLIDNGHGSNTGGKCSPPVEYMSQPIGTIGVLQGADGHHRLREYYYARLVAAEVVKRLQLQGYDARLLTPEQTDTPIRTRIARANSYARNKGTANVCVISVHLDACPPCDGKWHVPGGDPNNRWSMRVSLNASKNSKKLADCFAKAAEENDIGVRRPMPKQNWWPQNLAICRDTLCPAVLVEGKFQDNIDDVCWLTSQKGFEATVSTYVKAALLYAKS